MPYKAEFNLTYGKHAQQEAQQDRYGEVKFPTSLCLEKYSVIEVETDDNITPIKILVRISHCQYLDICIAFIPQTGIVKTVWLNKKTDKHLTLDRSKYDRF